MNDEEKEAIKTFKNIVIQEYDWWIDKGDYAESNVKEANNAIKIILNLIKKQEKEIEELKKKSYKCEYLEEGAEEIIKNSIGKDKIREKIKELVNKNVEVLGADRYEYAVRVLQELLEDE